MHLTPQFVSVGVNRVVNALDWGSNGLIAYGGHWIVCIYDHETAEVIGTLTGHKGQVNCVKWLPAEVNLPGVSLLLSGAADNTIRLWAWYAKSHSPPWRCITQLQVHSSPVTSLALHQLDPNTLLLASTSADPQLQLWHCCHGAAAAAANDASDEQQQQQHQSDEDLQARFGAAAWQLQPSVHVGTQIQHCIALSSFPEHPEWIVMATGGTDSSIRLFVRGPAAAAAAAAAAASPDHQQQQQQQGFKLQCQLKGHENWVRGLAFTQVAEPAAAAAAAAAAPGGGEQQRVSLLLASAAQDRYGRIWCITTDPSRSTTTTPTPPGSSSSSSGGGGSQADALRQLITRYAPRPHLTAASSTYWVSLEALLVGHEDWLHTLCWRPVAAAAAAAAAAAGSTCQPPGRDQLTLLTTSQDRSMILWNYDAPSGLWLNEAAVGDAGATCLGFYGGAFSPRGDLLVAHGFTGALHLWRQQGLAEGQSFDAAATAAAAANGSSSSSSRMTWVPQHALGGHYGSVMDLAWGADGGCLQSVGTDQTARLFTAAQGHWFELARTQVHGHDFSCIATIPTPAAAGSSSSSSSYSSSSAIHPALLYVSGSEEKVLRVFEGPQAFIDTLTGIRASNSPGAAAAVSTALAAAAAAVRAAADGGSGMNGSSGRGRAVGASVSALGLSNKALYVEDEGDDAGLSGAQGSGGAGGQGSGFGAEAYNEGPDFVPCATPGVVTGPPLEEHLAQNTLWPEIRKLYGHGNDVFCVCSSPSGRIIASACKAQSAGAAAVWVWEVGSWRAVTQLPGHTLTVTQLEFSPNGRYLLSGSRDRSFSVWKVPEQLQLQQQQGPAGSTDAANNAAAADGAFELLLRLKAAHSRIIWGVSWSHDSRLFATGSRDQSVKIWCMGSQGTPAHKPAITLPHFPAGVTAVALAPQHVTAAAAAGAAAAADGLHLLAVGLEDGQVQVWSVDVRGMGQAAGAAVDAGEGSGVQVQQLWVSQAWEKHAAAVRRLKWAPAGVEWLCSRADASQSAVLASCGEDHSVRVYKLCL